MKLSKTQKIIISSIIIISIVLLDQVTKHMITSSMTPYGEEKPIIGDFLVLRFIKNKGAAFGSFSNMTIVLAIISVLLILGLGYYYIKIIDDDKKRLLRIFISFVIGGAIGNLIDRVRLNYVVDFIYLKAINFPVFNVADIFVTVTMFLIIFIFIFSDFKEEKSEDKSEDKSEEKSKNKTDNTTEKIAEKTSEEKTDLESNDKAEDDIKSE